MQIIGDPDRKQRRLIDQAVSVTDDELTAVAVSFVEANDLIASTVPVAVTRSGELLVFDQTGHQVLLHLSLNDAHHDGNGTHIESEGKKVRILGPINAELRDFGTSDLPATVSRTNAVQPTQLTALREPLGSPVRWQYAVANVGSFNSPSRMASVLAQAGQGGWELVSVYDKASNWFQGMEKGFILLKRPVPPDEEPESWCLILGA